MQCIRNKLLESCQILSKKLFKRLHLNHAYGQLIALIFVPITILALCRRDLGNHRKIPMPAKAQQRQMAIAILTRFQPHC